MYTYIHAYIYIHTYSHTDQSARPPPQKKNTICVQMRGHSSVFSKADVLEMERMGPC